MHASQFNICHIEEFIKMIYRVSHQCSATIYNRTRLLITYEEYLNAWYTLRYLETVEACTQKCRPLWIFVWEQQAKIHLSEKHHNSAIRIHIRTVLGVCFHNVNKTVVAFTWKGNSSTFYKYLVYLKEILLIKNYKSKKPECQRTQCSDVRDSLKIRITFTLVAFTM